MRVWDDWGLMPQRGVLSGAKRDGREERMERENRWRRAWILAESRKTVRRWIEERERNEGRGEDNISR